MSNNLKCAILNRGDSIDLVKINKIVMVGGVQYYEPIHIPKGYVMPLQYADRLTFFNLDDKNQVDMIKMLYPEFIKNIDSLCECQQADKVLEVVQLLPETRGY